VRFFSGCVSRSSDSAIHSQRFKKQEAGPGVRIPTSSPIGSILPMGPRANLATVGPQSDLASLPAEAVFELHPRGSA